MLSLNNIFRHGQPSPGHQQIPIWPGAAPDPVAYDGPEYSVKVEEELVAGKPWISDERVSVPTMTVYPPKTRNTGAAVIVFPGGISDPRYGSGRY
jgi:hypothetical protein